jgi:hypothetical protein
MCSMYSYNNTLQDHWSHLKSTSQTLLLTISCLHGSMFLRTVQDYTTTSNQCGVEPVLLELKYQRLPVQIFKRMALLAHWWFNLCFVRELALQLLELQSQSHSFSKVHVWSCRICVSTCSLSTSYTYNQGFIQKINLGWKWAWHFHTLSPLTVEGVFWVLLRKLAIALIRGLLLTCTAAPKNIHAPPPLSPFLSLCR